MKNLQAMRLQPFFHTEECGCSCGHDHSFEEHHHHEHCHHSAHGHDHSHEEHHHHEHHHAAPTSGQIVYTLENLGCAHCAARMEEKINTLPGVESAVIVYATRQLRLRARHPEKLLPEIQQICASIESQVKVVEQKKLFSRQGLDAHGNSHDHGSDEQEERTDRIQIIAGAALFLTGIALKQAGISDPASTVAFVLSYIILGGKILLEAARNISRGQIFDENFLMGIATLGAFAIQEYPEAVGVMLFYRIGEYFEHKAVERSRSQIMEAVDLRPETVSLIHGSDIKIIPAEEAFVGDILLIRPGDRIPLDGTVIEGESRLDTSPITGEPVPPTPATASRSCAATSAI